MKAASKPFVPVGGTVAPSTDRSKPLKLFMFMNGSLGVTCRRRRYHCCAEDIMSRVVSFNRLLIGIAVACSLGIVYAIGAQSRTQVTIVLLQKARTELAATTLNKAGHRDRALALVDQAIAEVREGIGFAATQ